MLDSDSGDKLAQARAVMQPFLATLAAKSDVQAVYVLSSSARSPSNLTRFDEESDFDVSLVIDVPMAASEWRPRREDTYRLLADRIPSWVPNFLFYVPVPWGAMEVNVHQLLFQYESDSRTSWDGEKCDTYLTKREVVLDRDGRFEQLIEQKSEAARVQLAADHARLANRITWDVREMPFRQARRLGPASGHHIVNVAIDEVIDCVYALHRQFVPNKKWKLAQLVSRSFITITQAQVLHEALRCDPTSLADLERRVCALEVFCDSIDGIELTGTDALVSRRSFQSRIELRNDTFADSVSSKVMPSVADSARDVVNYSLCGSPTDLVNTLASYSLLESWQTVVPHVRAQLEQ